MTKETIFTLNEISSPVSPSKSNMARAEGVGAAVDEASPTEGGETDSDVVDSETVGPGSSSGTAGGADGVTGSGDAGIDEGCSSVL